MKNRIRIKIVNQSENSVPEYGTEFSAGMDLRANLDKPVVIGPLERAMIPTGLFIELPEGYEAQIRPRSGMSIKNGITVLNTPGTIDADYRGEIQVILVNLSKDKYTVKHGERICQMVISAHAYALWEEVEVLSKTTRGQGGFGHTGNN